MAMALRPSPARPFAAPSFFPGDLLPIRVDVDQDDRRYKDAFLWHSAEPDSSLEGFVHEALTDSGYPDSFLVPVLRQAQAQVSELRDLQSHLSSIAKDAQDTPGVFRASVENWEEECIHLIRLDLRVNSTVLQDSFYWDVNHPDSDPDGFARDLCRDLEISDPEVAPTVSIALREQLVEIARQAVGWREGRSLKKGRRGERGVMDTPSQLQRNSRGISLLSLLQSSTTTDSISVFRRRELWEAFGPSVEVLPEEEVLEAGEHKGSLKIRLKRKTDDRWS